MRDLELRIPAPNDWPRVAITQTCDVLSRGTAPTYVEYSSVFAIGQRCVQTSGFNASAARPQDKTKLEGTLLAVQGDVLLNCTGTGTIGRSCIFNGANNTYIVDGHVTLIRPNIKRLDGRWLNALLQSPFGQNHLETYCYSGSTNQVELSGESIAISRIPLPPISEQHCIAQILDTIDTQIQETEQLIVKLKLQEAGLLHDLFTFGLNEHRRLRNPISHPKQFRISELGRIPSGWKVEPIEDRLQQIIDYRGKTPKKTNSGIPLITAKNVREGFLDLSAAEYISEESYEAWMSRGIPNKGDVMFTTEAPLGNVARVPAEKIALSQRILTLCADPDNLDSSYLFWLLLWSASQRRLKQKSTGSTVVGIKQSVFRKVLFQFPSIQEQRAISQILDAYDNAIHAEEAYFNKLKLQKQALMHDLLTGRLRIRSKEEIVER